MCATYFVTALTMLDPQSSDAHHILHDVSAPSGISSLYKLWIPFLKVLLDRDLCKNLLEVHISSFSLLSNTKFQINRLQHIQNALARTVVQAPKFQHITPILKPLHWLKVSERIEYKIISLTYKILNTTQPLYLYDLISIQPPHGHNTRSSPYVTLIKPSSSLKVTHRSFRHASPHLWNQLPTSLRISHPNYSSPSQQPSFEHAGLTCYTLLSPSITFSLFHSELKSYLFRKLYPPP